MMCVARRLVLLFILVAAPSICFAATEYQPATLTIWNREVFTFRIGFRASTPQDRANEARRRIDALPMSSLRRPVTTESMRIGEYEGSMVFVDNRPMFFIADADIDPESKESSTTLAQIVATRLSELLQARAEQQTVPMLIRAIALSLGALLLLVGALWLLSKARRYALRRIDRILEKRDLVAFGVNVQSFIHVVKRLIIKAVNLALVLFVIYLCVTFILVQFPYTEPWGESLSTYLYNFAKRILSSIVASIPNLLMVLVIFVGARIVTRAASSFFRSVEHETISVSWLQPETAKATRRIVLVLIWAFALTIAYPYIPGSNTDAFKGISVFVGLMISLGSSGLVNQVISGLVVIYSRALKVGEYVRVGEVEGTVTDVGTLSTKIVTKKKEEITYPNAVLVGTTVVNYSRLAQENGAIVSTSVTIGYDAPWRQVHAMLLLAADRTSGVRKEPKPIVIQHALSDFYVEYALRVHLDRPDNRVLVLSELHAHIQDAFNEHGVQIMSPHFEAQPDRTVFVPKNQWHAAPANPSSDSTQPRGNNLNP